MTDELKSLIEDAAKLLGYPSYDHSIGCYRENYSTLQRNFNPLDPERGDLLKLAEAAKVSVRFGKSEVTVAEEDGGYKVFDFTKGNYQSLALAVLRAATTTTEKRTWTYNDCGT